MFNPAPQPQPPAMPDDTARLLTEVGFLAVGHGRLWDARIIFDGVRALRPDGVEWMIGMAFTLMTTGKAEEAIRLLAPEVERPDGAMVRLFLGWALKLAGRATDAVRVLDAVAHDEADARTARIARGLMGG